MSEPIEVSRDPWETHAGWWQEHFTDGADPEYEEQILPLAEEHLAGATRCSTSAAARVSSHAGSRRSTGRHRSSRAWIRPRVRSRPPSPAADTWRYARAVAERLPVRGRLVRRRRRLPHARAPRFPRARHRGDRPGAARPAAGSCCFLNHPLLQAPDSGWIDDQVLGEQYWRVGPYLPEDVAMEEVAPGVRLPFMHRPLSRYINVMADCGLLVEHMDEPPPPPGFLALAPEYGEAASIPRLLLLRPQARVTVDVAPALSGASDCGTVDHTTPRAAAARSCPLVMSVVLLLLYAGCLFSTIRTRSSARTPEGRSPRSRAMDLRRRPRSGSRLPGRAVRSRRRCASHRAQHGGSVTSGST